VTAPADWAAHLAASLRARQIAGLERRLRVAEGPGVRVRLDGREVLHFASNDYLGLSAAPEVVAAGQAALSTQGAGATASRLVCGTKPAHADLEAALAKFKRTAAARVCSSGYQASLAVIGALLENGAEENAEFPAPAVLLDRLSHASLLDGARLSGARVRTFKHNDAEDLRRLLEKENSGTRVLVCVESLYSMDGDVAPLRELYAVTHAAGALLLVDEAHATGVLGLGGRGVLSEVFDAALPPDVVALGTLSKALGSQGGFICAAEDVCKLLEHAGRAFLFTTGLAPVNAATARAALKMIEADEAHGGARRKGLLEKSERLRNALRTQGWTVLGGPGPIIPVVVGAEEAAVALAAELLKEGLWVPPIRFPTVKRGQARLRISLSAAHTDADLAVLERALAARKP